jgi:hypothetical protein
MKLFRILPLLALALPLTAAQAQEATVTTPAAPATNRAARGGRQETLKQIMDRLSQTTGLRVVADSALSRQQITAPEETVTKDTLDEYLTRLSRRLPGGAFAMKVYLPLSTESRRFTPDAMAQLARAQMDLLGRPAPNTVQIQGKVLSMTEADPIIRTLGLEPVYVLTTRQAMPFPAGASMINSSDMMNSLTKQLGVNNVADIPAGTYKVNVPGPDGTPREATVEVDNSDGVRKIRVMMGTPATPASKP